MELNNITIKTDNFGMIEFITKDKTVTFDGSFKDEETVKAFGNFLFDYRNTKFNEVDVYFCSRWNWIQTPTMFNASEIFKRFVSKSGRDNWSLSYNEKLYRSFPREYLLECELTYTSAIGNKTVWVIPVVFIEDIRNDWPEQMQPYLPKEIRDYLKQHKIAKTFTPLGKKRILYPDILGELYSDSGNYIVNKRD